ncbi:MAG: HNH endonuclease [Peptococcaceae bacterium]|nr:HNH endonuclease [Peptococcaceae bacterium]
MFYKSTKWKNKRAHILRRDEYMCRECKRYGKTAAATTVHHIYPLEHRPDLALVNENLVSLCNDHHEKMHNRLTGELTSSGLEWVERIKNKLSPLPLREKI